MKNQEFEFSLIDNTYSAEDAREVITSLINDKIRFLNIQILSIHERFGIDVTHLEKRVTQLEQDRKRLMSMLADYANSAVEIDVICDVKMVAKRTASINS